jgi:hypothetical protein
MRQREQYLQISLMANEQNIVQIRYLPTYSFGDQSATLQLQQFVQEIPRIQFR